jgi:hypothetical protein
MGGMGMQNRMGGGMQNQGNTLPCVSVCMRVCACMSVCVLMCACVCVCVYVCLCIVITPSPSSP